MSDAYQSPRKSPPNGRDFRKGKPKSARATPDLSTEQTHEHSWQPVGTVTEDEIAYSPVSVLDHQVRTVTLAVRSCSCGALRRTIISHGRWRWLNRKNR